MVNNERGCRQGPAVARRTERDLRRREALADAAAGISPGEGDIWAEAAGVERFRCVVYLCGAPHADLSTPRAECKEYAGLFAWEITEVIEEYAGLLPPQGREGLGRAVERVRSGAAGAVLTAWRSMVSPVPQEYDEVAREIERVGGFLHVQDPVRTRQSSAARLAHHTTGEGTP